MPTTKRDAIYPTAILRVVNAFLAHWQRWEMRERNVKFPANLIMIERCKAIKFTEVKTNPMRLAAPSKKNGKKVTKAEVLPLGESWSIMWQTITIWCLTIAHWTNAADDANSHDDDVMARQEIFTKQGIRQQKKSFFYEKINEKKMQKSKKSVFYLKILRQLSPRGTYH